MRITAEEIPTLQHTRYELHAAAGAYRVDRVTRRFSDEKRHARVGDERRVMRRFESLDEARDYLSQMDSVILNSMEVKYAIDYTLSAAHN